MTNKSNFIFMFFCLLLLATLTACGGGESSSTSNTQTEVKSASDPMKNMGIGPIKNLELPAEVDQEMADLGKVVYEEKCIACHNMDAKMIGPPQRGVLERRSPSWVMNMILNPEGMIKEDPIAKELLAEYNNVPMTNQQLTEEEARQIVEFFRLN